MPLLENEKSLRESEINNGAKIMLVGTTDFRVAEGLTKLWTYTKYGDLTACNLKIFEKLEELLFTVILNTLPPTLGLLTSLRRLDVANNKLTALPIEIGNLTKLEDLQVNNNRISSISSSIGNCASLIEVDLSSNYLSELLDEFCSLHNLKALHISNNAMKSLPNSLFRMCAQLSTLAVHNTEITTDTLLQCEGWEDFQERRHAECQRRREEHFNSAEFDELADTIFSDFLRNRDGCSAS